MNYSQADIKKKVQHLHLYDSNANNFTLEVCPVMLQSMIMLYVLSYPHFEEPVSRALATFRDAHEKERARLVAPHITLVFALADSLSHEIKQVCEQVASQISGITIEFSNSEIIFDPFENKHKIILLTSLGRDCLTTLHEQLYEGVCHKELYKGELYRPHMTVATNSDRLTIENVDTTPLGFFPIKANISSLEVVKLTDGKLSTISSIPLGM